MTVLTLQDLKGEVIQTLWPGLKANPKALPLLNNVRVMKNALGEHFDETINEINAERAAAGSKEILVTKV